VVAYTDGDSSLFYGTARVGELNGGLIVYGPETVFNAANTRYISLEALSTSKVIVVYQDDGNSEYGTAVIGDVYLKNITFGSEYVFSVNTVNFTSVGLLNSSKFVIAYQSDGTLNKGKAVIATCSGNVITFGAETIFNDAPIGSVSVGGFPWVGDQFVVAYRDNGDSGKGKAIIGEVTSYTVAYGSETTFNEATYDIAVMPLSVSKFVVAYADSANSYYGTARVGDISAGTVITFGSEEIFNPEATYIYHGFGIAHMSDTRFVVGYSTSNIEREGEGRTVVGDVVGNAITFGSQMQINSGSFSGTPTVCGQKTTESFVVCWSDQSRSAWGKCSFYGGTVLYLPLVRK
jgi:hypothetical protein